MEKYQSKGYQAPEGLLDKINGPDIPISRKKALEPSFCEQTMPLGKHKDVKMVRSTSKGVIRYHNKSAMAGMIKDVILDAPPRPVKEEQPFLNFSSR